jgi:hypothetical protein
VLRNMHVTSRGFGIEAEIVIKAGRLKATVVEIPIEYGRRIGQSKLSPVRDGLIIGRTIASLALSRVAERQPPVPSPGRPTVGEAFREELGPDPVDLDRWKETPSVTASAERSRTLT